jgi:hypothetical protein
MGICRSQSSLARNLLTKPCNIVFRILLSINNPAKSRARSPQSNLLARLFGHQASRYTNASSRRNIVPIPLLHLPNMPRRKRTATIMDTPAEIAGAGAEAGAEVSTAAEQGTAGSDTVPSRAVLQSRPNPPAKRTRSSGQRDKEKPSSGSRKAQELLKVRPPAATAAISLPPEIWRLIGQTVNSS